MAWAGGCLDNDPLYRTTPRDLPVAVTPGGTSTGPVTLGPIEVKNRAATGTKTMIAYHAVDTSCPKVATLNAKDSTGAATTFDYGAAVTLGSATSAGIKTSLPYGKWRIYDGTYLAARDPHQRHLRRERDPVRWHGTQRLGPLLDEGMTLVEVMVAVSLSVLLLFVVGSFTVVGSAPPTRPSRAPTTSRQPGSGWPPRAR